MYVRRTIDASVIWFFSRRALLNFTALSVVVLFAYTVLHITVIAIPFLPIATIGTAVAFYVGFKNNASYERLWEARKIWAEIEYLSRLLADLIVTLPRDLPFTFEQRSIFVNRQISWLNSLRLMLRKTHPFHSEEVGGTQQTLLVDKKTGVNDTKADIWAMLAPLLSAAEVKELRGASNLPSAILRLHMQSLQELEQIGLEDFRADRIYEVIKELGQQQAAAERINGFPFPRQYAHFSNLFVNIFIFLLPFSLLSELKSDPHNLWLLVPCSILISWVFYTMEKVGDTSENPFENGINDVPLSAICKNLEIEMRQALKMTDIPEPLAPKEHILM